MARDRSCFETEKLCPKCGANLWSDGARIWCAHWTPETRIACTYGVTEVITVEEHEEATK